MGNFLIQQKIQRYEDIIVTRLSRCLRWSRWRISGVWRRSVYWYWIRICLTWQERWITWRLIYRI